MILLTLLACGTAPDRALAPAHDPADVPSSEPVAAIAIQAPMGEHTARLMPADDHLMVLVVDADGASVAPVGDGTMVLTGTGEEAQPLVLTPEGAGWRADATLSDAPGYLAVVSVPVDGATQSARFSWGDVPEADPAPDH